MNPLTGHRPRLYWLIVRDAVEQAVPEVSVIIPTRDRWPYLRAALDSAFGQDDVAVEVVVIDDGSTDATPVRLADYRDNRLRVLRHEAPVGVSRARNRGIELARAEWVAFLDDDDLWAANKLREQLGAALAANATWAYTAKVFVDESIRPLWVEPASDRARVDDLLRHNAVGTPSCVLARRDALVQVSGFDTALSIMADWDLWIRLAAHSEPAPVTAPLTGERLHNTNMQWTLADRILDEYRHMRVKHAALIEHKGDLGGYEYWAWVTMMRRLAGMRGSAALSYLALAVRYRNPRDVLRAFGVPFGEGVMRLGRGPHVVVDEPEWLAAHRAGLAPAIGADEHRRIG